jgi:hypothetical protein
MVSTAEGICVDNTAFLCNDSSCSSCTVEPSICQSCIAPKYLTSQGTCVNLQECPPNTYKINQPADNKCLNCHDSCLSCNGPFIN